MNFIFSPNFPYKHFTTAKSAGDMKNKAERDSFFRSVNLNPDNLVLANQVHGNNVKIVKSCDKNNFIDNCDGLITDDKNLLLGIFTADCVPILVSCSDGKVKAAVHVGWKGLYLGIVENAIGILINDFCINPKNLKVYIGPHIRSCCYKTGTEMEDKFNIKLANGKLDLSAILRTKLESCGVNEIFDVNQCTCHNEQLFFSYRRDCCADRLLSVI
ncbi:peptidoglycan editing factor PgeF [Candidatus Endomicrobiellum devescovinae]|jgi:YfiH family protein|uniref:peptidoglycan editing factor PgeF n=1 Tax=Candidatus Endomicrobiellum devescovinae TaxID=3242322 RepID=UPI0028292865|nr:peptidoglycan editing factor PgeF [Endomicrobium sp.]